MWPTKQIDLLQELIDPSGGWALFVYGRKPHSIMSAPTATKPLANPLRRWRLGATERTRLRERALRGGCAVGEAAAQSDRDRAMEASLPA